MSDWNWQPADDQIGGDDANLPTHGGNGGAVATQISLGRQIEVRRAAMALPRDPGNVARSLEQMAEWSGDGWEYEFPIGGQLISGPSIKCTNAVARAWGNCSVMTSNVQDIGDSWIIYSTFIDHQTGFDLTRGFRQRKGQKTIRTDAGRAEDIVFQIGVSKSARNVVRNALGDVVDRAISYARRRMSKAIEAKPDDYRKRIADRLAEIEYPLVKVEAWAAGPIAKWPVPMIAQVIRILTAHAEGAVTDLDTMFAPKGVDLPGEAAEVRQGDPMDRIVERAQQAKTEPQPEPEPPSGGGGGAPTQEARQEPAAASPAAPEPARHHPSSRPSAAQRPAQPAQPAKRGGRPTTQEMIQARLDAIAAATDVAEVEAVTDRLPSTIRSNPPVLARIEAAAAAKIAEIEQAASGAAHEPVITILGTVAGSWEEALALLGDAIGQAETARKAGASLVEAMPDDVLAELQGAADEIVRHLPGEVEPYIDRLNVFAGDDEPPDETTTTTTTTGTAAGRPGVYELRDHKGAVQRPDADPSFFLQQLRQRAEFFADDPAKLDALREANQAELERLTRDYRDDQRIMFQVSSVRETLGYSEPA